MFVKIKEWNGRTHLVPISSIELITDDIDSKDKEIQKKAKTTVMLNKNKTIVNVYSSDTLEEIEQRLQVNK
jgi:hypothetical protein